MRRKRQLRNNQFSIIILAFFVLVFAGFGFYKLFSSNAATQTANIWVDTNGGSCVYSASPVAYNDASACGSFQSAYNATACGDKIGVEAGTYTQIEIDSNGRSCSSSVNFVPDNGVVSFVTAVGNDSPALSLGNSCKCSAHKPPDHITFDGGPNRSIQTGKSGVMDMGGQMGQIKVYPDYETPASSDVLPDHLVFKNMIICNKCPDHGGGTIEIGSDSNTTIDNVQIGPVCCGVQSNGADGTSPTLILVGHRDEGSGSHMTTNLTISNSQLLGETYCGSAGGPNPDCAKGNWPSSLGPPPQPNCSSPNNCHADCVHFTGIDGVIVRNNIMYQCRAQALFFENQNSGYSRDGTIIGNYLDSLNSCSFCEGGSTGQVNTTRGTWVFAFNTGNAGMGFAGPSTFATGVSITFVGNYGPLGNSGDDTNHDYCSFLPPGGSVAYNYNVWTNISSGCSSTDKTVASLNVAHIGDWSSTPPDNNTSYDLPGTITVADSLVPANVCIALTTSDLYGTPRPQSSACEAGAYERPVGSPPPPQPPPPPPPPPTKPGDCNNDSHVDITDLSILLTHFNQNYSACDFNSDSIVNIFDLSTLLTNFGA